MRKRLSILSLVICLAAMISMLAVACNINIELETDAPITTVTQTTNDEVDITVAITETTADEQTPGSSEDNETNAPQSETTKAETSSSSEATLDENGEYTSKDDVALYIHLYGHLPSNFVTKKEAQKKGWEGGSLEGFFPGCSIGGDVFGNREGLLPKKDGRKYYECDIDTKGAKSRGAKRIVFSNDGLVYYTEDHYESFTLLYGEE
ncbi:MAG: ribonuclease [Saccharofermentans sp.]|nr:ribonuclease [Saccharofermentans sp.]